MTRITQVLSIGPFVSPERVELLRASGVTHVLNVSDAASEVTAGGGSFREVVDLPLCDFSRLPEQVATATLDTLHRMASQPDAHVYVHCIAGHMRSPTILWLYLIACGIPPDDAHEIIKERSPDARPGHPKLVDHRLILHVQKHGLLNYSPHPRPGIVVPFKEPSA